MHVSSRLIRRCAALSSLAVAATVLASTGAHADHQYEEQLKVRENKAWQPGYRYQATATLDGRNKPKRQPVAKSNYVKRGDWVYIKCQTVGERAYGSRIWSKVNFDGGKKAYYVPDAYIRTYTRGFVEEVPRCGTRVEPLRYPSS